MGPARVRPCSIAMLLSWYFAVLWSCDAAAFYLQPATTMVYKYNFMKKYANSADSPGWSDGLRGA